MATTPYIILTNSTGGPASKTFYRVMLEGYGVTDRKSQSMRVTAGGDWDITEGAVKEIHQYIIRIRETEPTTGYGALADLRTLYALNNPGASPSNILQFTDHYGGSARNAMLVGELTRNILGIEIEGNQAWFYVKATIYVL